MGFFVPLRTGQGRQTGERVEEEWRAGHVSIGPQVGIKPVSLQGYCSDMKPSYHVLSSEATSK